LTKWERPLYNGILSMNRICLLILSFFLFTRLSYAQKKEDTLVVRNDSIVPAKGVDSSKLAAKDTITKKKHSPRKAAIRSAILPGWGQVYNRKIWKVPIVYGALGTTAGIFMFNLKQYKDIQFAYRALVNNDSAKFDNVAPELKDFIKYNARNDLFNARSEVRQNIDYSVLVFLLFWGLNVVDALVDAHLKDFDVSPDISMKIKPTYNSNFSNVGMSLVFDIHKSKPRQINLPRAIP
jgi:hypothetical protein